MRSGRGEGERGEFMGVFFPEAGTPRVFSLKMVGRRMSARTERRMTQPAIEADSLFPFGTGSDVVVFDL